MTQAASDWPEPKANLHIPVLLNEATDTHQFSYTADGLLHVGVECAEGASEYVKQSRMLTGEVVLNKTNRQMLRHLIDQADAYEAQTS
jgi:hypothetical protein